MGRAKELTLSTVVAAVGSLAVLAPVANYVLAGEVAKQVSPLVKSQRVLLQQTLDTLMSSIAAMQYKKDTCHTPECWTQEDAKNVARMGAQLNATAEALKALE